MEAPQANYLDLHLGLDLDLNLPQGAFAANRLTGHLNSLTSNLKSAFSAKPGPQLSNLNSPKYGTINELRLRQIRRIRTL